MERDLTNGDDPAEPRSRETLASYVKRVRTQVRNISLQEVARRSGGEISRGYISQIENGFEINPSPKKLRALAGGLGVPLTALLKTVGAEPTNEAEFQESALYFLYQQRLTATEDVRWLIDETISMLLDRIDKARSSHPTHVSEEEGKEKEPLPGRQ